MTVAKLCAQLKFSIGDDGVGFFYVKVSDRV